MSFLTDTDNDGHTLDEGFGMVPDFLGGCLKGAGAVAMGIGGLTAAFGGAAATTGVGAPVGLSGAAMGALIGMGGGLAMGAGEVLQTDFMGSLAASAGDFTAGLFGMTPAVAPGTPAAEPSLRDAGVGSGQY